MPKVISQAAPVTLSPEREQQLADWKKKEAADEAVKRIRDGSITDVTYDPKTATLVVRKK